MQRSKIKAFRLGVQTITHATSWTLFIQLCNDLKEFAAMKIQLNILETHLEDVGDDSKHTACDL